MRRAAELFEPADADAARAHLTAYDEARHRGDIRAAVRAHGSFHFALYEAARSSWLLRLIRPAWDSCERYRPVLLAEGTLQDRHEELDVELLEACTAHDADRAGRRCTTISSSRATLHGRAQGPLHLRVLRKVWRNAAAGAMSLRKPNPGTRARRRRPTC